MTEENRREGTNVCGKEKVWGNYNFRVRNYLLLFKKAYGIYLQFVSNELLLVS